MQMLYSNKSDWSAWIYLAGRSSIQFPSFAFLFIISNNLFWLSSTLECDINPNDLLKNSTWRLRLRNLNFPQRKLKQKKRKKEKKKKSKQTVSREVAGLEFNLWSVLLSVNSANHRIVEKKEKNVQPSLWLGALLELPEIICSHVQHKTGLFFSLDNHVGWRLYIEKWHRKSFCQVSTFRDLTVEAFSTSSSSVRTYVTRSRLFGPTGSTTRCRRKCIWLLEMWPSMLFPVKCLRSRQWIGTCE